MFVDFFLLLREYKIPVSITEYLSLVESLDRGLVNSPMEFYYVARSLLVKDEKYFDIYDQVFLKYFKDARLPLHIHDELKKWLENPLEILKYKVPSILFESRPD